MWQDTDRSHLRVTAFPLALMVAGTFFILANSQTVHAKEADSPSPPQHFFVSTEGNDKWSGKLPAPNAARSNGPFATLTRARDAIRALKASGRFDSPVIVNLMGGKYWLQEPFRLGDQDSGASEKPIAYKAYPGDKPVLSGGRRLTGWKPYRGSIVQTTLPEVKEGRWKFRELYFNGKRQIRARWPNLDLRDPLYAGWAFIEAIVPPEEKEPSVFRYASTPIPPRRWAKVNQVEMKVIPWYCWADDLIPLKSTNPAQRVITLARPAQPAFMALMTGNRFYIENALEELDQPGEWVLDSETGTLYFWPPSGNLSGAEVVAPVTDRLIELRGTTGSPIHHVAISGLTLTQTRSTWPEQRHENFHSPLLRGEAIRLENAEDCRVANNVIRTVGGDGVRLQGTCARNRVAGNEIAFTGGQGVSLASDSVLNTGFWTDKAELRRISALYPRSAGNVVSNNHIHHTGEIKKNGGAIHLYAINSVDNLISHNLIHDTADKGMTMQDGYGRFTVEYNEMRDLASEISDTGALMTNRWHLLEDDPELGGRITIRNNFIRNVIGCGAYDRPREGKGALRTKAGGKIWTPYYTWGIYFDNSGMNRDVYDNIVVGTVLGGVSMPVGDPKNNRFENNILVGGSAYLADLRIGGNAAVGNRFLRNILYATSPGAALLNVTPKQKEALAVSDFNLYFAGQGQPLKVAGMKDGTLRDWQALGFDTHSVVADPLFVDPAHHDFRLKPESPAFELGFRPIDMDRIGRLDK